MTDQQWRDIARQVVAKVGLAPDGDEQAVRWIAMRHGADHIHIVATLVRQDRRTYWARNDYPLAQAACRDIEDQLRPGPGRAARAGQPVLAQGRRAEQDRPAGVARSRPATSCAAESATPPPSLSTRTTSSPASPHDRTVNVRLRDSERNPGQITGYAVHLAGDTTADGEPIFYSGGRLAADLSLNRLRQRWHPDTTLAGTDRRARQLRPPPAEIYRRAAVLIGDATRHMTANPEEMTGIAAGAADMLTALAAAWEGTDGRSAHSSRRTVRSRGPRAHAPPSSAGRYARLPAADHRAHPCRHWQSSRAERPSRHDATRSRDGRHRRRRRRVSKRPAASPAKPPPPGRRQPTSSPTSRRSRRPSLLPMTCRSRSP